jgi:hypothetical protein
MVSQGGLSGGGADGYDVASILGDSRSRRILSILLDRAEPMSSRELSVHIAAQEAGVPPAAVSEAEYGPVLTALEHRHLPKLERVGWVDHGPLGLTAMELHVAPTDALSMPSLREPEHPHWEPISALLSHPYRIVLLALLAERQQSASLATFAAQLRECEHLPWVDSLPDQQQLRARLYHVDVPKLADIGLLAFDTAEQTITHTALTSDIVEHPASILE